ncbi:MAG: hypothetical protein R3C39_10570 [Dehalococcoidia bacterium]
MVAATGSRWVVEPGRRTEFVGAVRKAKSIIEPLGASVQLRQTWSGGENAGQLTLVLVFDSEKKRGEVLDTLRSERLLASFGNLVDGPNSPARLLSRVWLNEVGGPGTMPMPRNILQTLSFALAPGQGDAGLAALEAAREKHLGMGAEPRLWRLVNAGALSGTYIYGVQFDGLSEQADFWTSGLGSGPLPLQDAVRAGVLVSIGGGFGYSISL